MTAAEVRDIHPLDPTEDEGSELLRLQSRLDDLSTRIHDAVPDGYDLDALVKAADESHGREDVFEITAERDALVGVEYGPLNVPGRTPPPEFKLGELEAAAIARAVAAHESKRRNGISLAIFILLVLLGGIAGLFLWVPTL